MYMELKTGYSHNGPARIGRVTFSHSGKTIYYRGRAFRRLRRASFAANHYDVETGEEYWISGCKKNGQDRHRFGSGPVEIDDDAKEEYWRDIRRKREHKE